MKGLIGRAYSIFVVFVLFTKGYQRTIQSEIFKKLDLESCFIDIVFRWWWSRNFLDKKICWRFCRPIYSKHDPNRNAYRLPLFKEKNNYFLSMLVSLLPQTSWQEYIAYHKHGKDIRKKMLFSTVFFIVKNGHYLIVYVFLLKVFTEINWSYIFLPFFMLTKYLRCSKYLG